MSNPDRLELLKYRHWLWKADQEYAHKLIDPLDVDREVPATQCVVCGYFFEKKSRGHKRCQTCQLAKQEREDIVRMDAWVRRDAVNAAHDGLLVTVRTSEALNGPVGLPRAEWYRTVPVRRRAQS